MDKSLKRGISAIASAALLGGSLFLGAGAANAIVCPAGQHAITMGGVSDCVPNASGGGTGGAITYDGGGQPNTGAPAPIQVPGYNAPGSLGMPVTVPPPYHPVAPVQAPAAPAAPQAPQYVPSAPQAPVYSGNAGGYRPAATGQAPAFTPASGGAPVVRDAATGGWVNPETGAPASADVAAQASAAEAAAPAAEAPAAAPAVVLPTTEVQAVDALRSATATAAEKQAAQVIVKAKIDAVLDKAIDKALANH